MTSIHYEGLVEIVRQHPPVAVEILRHVGTFGIPDPAEATLGDDGRSVIASDPATGERLLAVIIEPQEKADEHIGWDWPVYVTAARLADQCPRAVLIGACWDLAEAEKCRELIAIGHPGFVFAPIVVDSRTPFDLASGSPYLTLFSTVLGGIDLASDEGSRLVAGAITRTRANPDDRRALTDIILGIASGTARRNLEEVLALT